MSIIKTDKTAIIDSSEIDAIRAAMGKAANRGKQMDVFSDYRNKKSKNTVIAQKHAIRKFCAFLNDASRQAVGIDVYNPSQMFDNPHEWRHITFGLVSSFIDWSKDQGHSLSSINQRLSVIKKYSELASISGSLSPNELAMIKTVQGIHKPKEQMNVNAQRAKTKERTKTTNTLTAQKVREIFAHITSQNTQIAKRDNLLACLLFRHGLRASEIVLLTDESFKHGELVFKRPKVGRVGRHRLYMETLQAYNAYKGLALEDAFFRSAMRGGLLSNRVLIQRTLIRTVKRWGDAVGISSLSPHDARHTLATKLAHDGLSANELLDFFGWSSLSTAQRYVQSKDVGNRGIMVEW